MQAERYMKDILKPEIALETISRIEKINEHSKPLWGRMTAAQMLAHCQAAFRVYFDEQPLKANFVMKIFGPMMKKMMLSPKPWKQNLPTAKEFVIKHEPNLEAEKQRLVGYVNRFVSEAPDKGGKKHPVFGYFSLEEWSQFMWKHTDHHLTQFNV